MDVDIDSIMEDLREEITRIHAVCCVQDGNDAKAKPTINILEEIESKLSY